MGLEKKLQDARAFYGTIALAMTLGLGMLLLPVDPIRALFWSAVLNGIIAVPLLAATMIVVSNRQHLGAYVAPPGLKIMVWPSTAAMAEAALAKFVL